MTNNDNWATPFAAQFCRNDWPPSPTLGRLARRAHGYTRAALLGWLWTAPSGLQASVGVIDVASDLAKRAMRATTTEDAA